MVSIPVIAHFAAATFFGNVAFSAMGFGMAICYLFVYQIGALAGLIDCCGLPGLKYAVFIQTIGMAVIQPIVLWKVNLRKNFRAELLLTMLPAQFIGAPVGQFLQAYTPSEILKIVVGVATIGVAGWQIFNIIRTMRADRSTNYDMVEVTVENTNEKDGHDDVNGKDNETPKSDAGKGMEEILLGGPKENGVEHSKELRRRTGSICPNENEMEHYKLGNEEGVNDYEWKEKKTGGIKIPITLGSTNGVNYITLSSGYHRDLEERLEAEDMLLMKHMLKMAVRKIINQMWPIKPVIIWMTLAGLVSGFLGGLIGVRSPPLIIFFFIYEFPPVEVKANGAVIATANTLVRIIMYVCNPPPSSYPHPSWFAKEDIYLYLTVSVVAVIASPIGLYLTKYLAKKGYKLALTALLIVNGITMITTAAMDLM